MTEEIDITALPDLTTREVGSSVVDLGNIGDIESITVRPYDFRSRPYDIDEDREQTRGKIAMTLTYALIGIIAVPVLTTFLVLVYFGIVKSSPGPYGLTTGVEAPPIVAQWKSLLEIILTPIVGLVGAVTGFYFGGKTN